MAKTKHEIDKEQMYQKLMPSAARAAREQEAAQRPLGGERAAVPSAPAQIPTQRQTGPHRVAVPTLDCHPMVVVNVMEVCVLSKLDELLECFSCCRCDRCKKDIVALALNKLPPKYMVLAEGQPEPDVDQQTNAQVVAAMIQAVIKVRANPRH